MIIDVTELFNIKSENDSEIIEYMSRYIYNIELLVIDVGNKLTIGRVEKKSSFIRKVAKLFYSMQSKQIKSCKLLNTPKCFKTIFIMIKPLLSKDALNVIEIYKSNEPVQITNSI
tara:strand:- start:271 stop:615 length:345 start_codon:yes stop_codon:yes gene_type:complete